MPSAALRHEQKVCFLTWAARLSFALYHGPAWSLGDAEMFSPEGPELELHGGEDSEQVPLPLRPFPGGLGVLRFTVCVFFPVCKQASVLQGVVTITSPRCYSASGLQWAPKMRAGIIPFFKENRWSCLVSLVKIIT